MTKKIYILAALTLATVVAVVMPHNVVAQTTTATKTGANTATQTATITQSNSNSGAGRSTAMTTATATANPGASRVTQTATITQCTNGQCKTVTQSNTGNSGIAIQCTNGQCKTVTQSNTGNPGIAIIAGQNPPHGIGSLGRVLAGQPNQNRVLGQDRVPHVGQILGQILGQQGSHLGLGCSPWDPRGC